MRHGGHIGRVGLLAVALGIGTAVGASPGIASATSEDGADSASSTAGTSTATAGGTDSAPSTSSAATPKPKAHKNSRGPSKIPASADPGTAVADDSATTPVAGSAEPDTDTDTDTTVAADQPDSTTSTDPAPKKSKKSGWKPKTSKSAPSDRAAAESATSSATDTPPNRDVATVDRARSAADAAAAAVSAESATVAVQTPGAATLLPAAQPAATSYAEAATSKLTLRSELSSFLDIFTDGPVESPLAWLVLAAARLQVGKKDDTTTDLSAQQIAANQTVAAADTPTTTAAPMAARSLAIAAVVDAAPTATVAWGRPDATTGTVSGVLTTTDPEGKQVGVTLTSPPASGHLTFDAKTATLTYTPTTAQRFAAWNTTEPNDTIGMTLTVTDGVNSTVVPVDIPVSASPFHKVADYTGLSDAAAVAATNTRAYIANRDTGTVTVYDTVKKTVVGTYQAGTAPDGIALTADGTKLYVSSSTANTVTVIDTGTGKVKATVAVTNPTAMTFDPSGKTMYVAGSATATITKISVSTNKATGTVKLTAGLTPKGLAVSADGKTIYVASATAAGGNISSFSSTGTTLTSVTDIPGAPTGFAISQTYSRLFVTDATGRVTMVNTSTGVQTTVKVGVPVSGITVTKDSSALMVTTTTGLVAGISTSTGQILGVIRVRDSALAAPTVAPGVTLSPDGTQMYVTDYDTDTVHAVSLVPSNIAPFSSDPYVSVTSASTGQLTGRVGVIDYDGDPLTYTVTSSPTKGKLVLNADGTYTYTPTASARHAAAVPNAAAAITTDSFTVTVSDGRNGSVSTTLTLPIAPANKAPTVTTTIGSPSSSTGVVKGSIKSADGDSDKRTYTLSAGPAKGTVTVTSTGSFTYTPTPAARAAATAPGATHDAKQDTFTVTVDDGHGGAVPVTVNVKIGAANVKPTGAKATVAITNPRSGVATGTVAATDTDGDTLTYTAGATTKGTLVINNDGTFTYTPTAAARLAASKTGASSSTKSETITITVSDGFGGTTKTSLKVFIAPNPTTNTAPTNGVGTVQDTSTALGTVTGTVTAADADGDALTYSLASGPTFGTAAVTAAGKFTYTPDVDSRYGALVTTGEDTDSFVVNISDGFGGTTTATVKVPILPPSTTAIDQRATTVGVTTQQMYFYSQADTDKAIQVLKDAGVDTIRIMLPWAGVEAQEDTYDWSAIDRMVNSADANGIKVLAAINSTPDWAVAPGQPARTGEPADIEAFGEFVSAVATRYQGKVADYEIWNEPNYQGFWQPTPDAAQYTALLKVAYTAIKQADPDAVVVAASVAAVNERPGGPAVNPVTFLTQMYAAGAAGYFDAVAFHPYLYSVTFSGGEGHAGTPITQAEQLYAVMVANGDGNKKIWATEYGQPSSVVSEANQAAYIGDFLRTWRTLDFAGPAFIHTLADYATSSPTEASFGLVHQDWTPKPALTVVEQVITENAALNAAASLV